MMNSIQPPRTLLASWFLGMLFLTVNAQDQNRLQDAIGDQNVADFWSYDDLETGLEKARETGKPLLVTIRCVPCEACKGMDEKVANPTDLALLNLMSQFVCVRIVQAWGLDLSQFQYDMNMSWAAFMLNADNVIYGRYGTRAAQRDDDAITVGGFKKALTGALALHQRYQRDAESMRDILAGKIGAQRRWSKPDDIPIIQKTVRWGKPLGRVSATAQAECLHCHFVPAAEMMSLLDAGQPIADRHLWAYPLPETVGLSFDPASIATVRSVTQGLNGHQAGFQEGDQILTIENQPILSIADVQWILHNAGDTDTLDTVVHRNNDEVTLQLQLEEGWRRRDEFVSRVSTWDFFKVKLFGVNTVETLNANERGALNIPKTQMALRIVKLSPQWGDMNHDARKAGLKEGDVMIQADDRKNLTDYSKFLAYLVQHKKSGDVLNLTVLRSQETVKIEVPLNWTDRLKALRTP